MKKRRLTDLYITGRPCVIDDGMGDSVEVWLQKPSPVEHETCMRRANAARARVLMVRHDRNSEEWQSMYSEVIDAGDRDWHIEYILGEEIADAQSSIEARIASAEEWSNDDYLQGLNDAWEGTDGALGLKDEYARDFEHPEAKKCLEEMKRFTDQVKAELDPVVDDLKSRYAAVDDESLQAMVVDRFLQMNANSAWIRELNKSELFYAVREPDNHARRYFDRREDLDVLAPEVLGALKREYDALIVEPSEGKGSEVTDSSSSSSEQPETEDPASHSGPLAAVQ